MSTVPGLPASTGGPTSGAFHASAPPASPLGPTPPSRWVPPPLAPPPSCPVSPQGLPLLPLPVPVLALLQWREVRDRITATGSRERVRMAGPFATRIPHGHAGNCGDPLAPVVVAAPRSACGPW